MATKKEIEAVLTLMHKTRPARSIREMNTIHMGIGAVIRYLHEKEAKSDVTAGEISEFLNVSTARVAVILSKMEKKGLITRSRGQKDARVTVVQLTQAGTDTAKEMQRQFEQQVEKAIDKVGCDRMLEFVSTMHELHEIFLPLKVKELD